ncbi:hypothetical protein NE237_017778 [Protea cynaroides]|uniref:Peptidase M10 metallopeptidase domain-containing protein n=1 Tax=Protea cynaroides TaxID=273540 RepID=A0A9Q0K8M8_9MAGN|nr:hypothetical protein NE237_017778 [Protea cynaroides]
MLFGFPGGYVFYNSVGIDRRSAAINNGQVRYQSQIGGIICHGSSLMTIPRRTDMEMEFGEMLRHSLLHLKSTSAVCEPLVFPLTMLHEVSHVIEEYAVGVVESAAVEVGATRFQLEETKPSIEGNLDLGRFLEFLSMETGIVPSKEGASIVELDWLVQKPEWKIMDGKDHFMVAGRVTWAFRRIGEKQKCHSPSNVMQMFQSSPFCLQPTEDDIRKKNVSIGERLLQITPEQVKIMREEDYMSSTQVVIDKVTELRKGIIEGHEDPNVPEHLAWKYALLEDGQHELLDDIDDDEGDTGSFITNSNNNQLEDNTKTIISCAFERWSVVTSFIFIEIDNYLEADVKIGFYVGNLGVREPFNGPMGTLTYTFFPTIGWFHFDDKEDWVVKGDVA